ncbi:MAG: hypothetical protein KGS45_03980 [Planctomycetes bacterium]|nr:hypothetical protein [Planctomycetota bacterium]
MPVFRRNKSPLFDLVRGGSSNSDAATPTTPTRPPIQVEATSIPSRPRPTLSAHAPGDESTTADRINALRSGTTSRPTGGLVSMPLNSIYLTIAGVIALVIVIWAAAYWLGGRAKEKELAPYISAGVQPSATPSDTTTQTNSSTSSPAAGGSNPTTFIPPPRLSGSSARPDPVPQPSNTNPPTLSAPTFTGPGTIITSKGMTDKDPREAGLNYLAIVRLPRADAEKVVAFMAANGFEAIGVPVAVEKGSKAANNLPLYQIIALQGISGEQYRKEDPIKVKVDQEVQRLGVIWKRDHRGSTNFMQSGWVKYKGDGQ